MSENPLKAALYIRVSTDEQTEYSPAAQKKALIDYANKNGMKAMPEYIFVDEGFSGRTANKRPNFMRMIGVAKTKPKPFDVILVHKFDRFARNREDSVVYKSMLQREHNIKVISISETMDDSPMSILLEAMLEAIAEYYSINLSKEVKKGMTEKAEQGGYQTTPPLGYTMGADNVLLISEQEAQYVRYIFNEYIYNDKTPGELSLRLNRMGVKSKRGNPIDTRGVQYILQNPIYTGMVRWTPTEKAKRNFNHPDSIVRRGKHDPIIPEELFESAVAKLRESMRKTKPRARPAADCKHWLSGLLRCSKCGYTLNLVSRLKSPSFQCNGYLHGKCRVSHSITVRRLERAIIAELNNALENSESCEYRLNAAGVDTSEQVIEFVRRQIERLADRQVRAKKAYLDEIDTLEEYKRTKAELESERCKLEAELCNFQNECTENTGNSALKEKLKGVMEIITSDCDMPIKQKAVRSIIERIIYDKPNEILEVYYYDA